MSNFIPDTRSRSTRIGVPIIAARAADLFPAEGTLGNLVTLKAVLGGLPVRQDKESTGLDFGQHGELA